MGTLSYYILPNAYLMYFPFSTLKKINGIRAITSVLEENALVKYRDKQDIVTIKGVSEDFHRTSGLDSMIAAWN